MVFDSSFDTSSVIKTPSTIAASTYSAAAKDPEMPAAPAEKITERVISVGNRPLQGTKLLVMVAMRRSRGESIIRQAITPAALHPNPMHMVSACFPWAQAFLK